MIGRGGVLKQGACGSTWFNERRAKLRMRCHVMGAFVLTWLSEVALRSSEMESADTNKIQNVGVADAQAVLLTPI